mgnify:CR=1 FL=1
MRIDPYRAWKDPNKLTPYEEKIYALRQQGLTTKQIAEALGPGRSATSIASTLSVIRDKLGLRAS